MSTTLNDVNYSALVQEVALQISPSELPISEMFNLQTEVLASQNTTISVPSFSLTGGTATALTAVDWTSDGNSTMTTYNVPVDQVAREAARPGYLASEIALRGYAKTAQIGAVKQFNKTLFTSASASTTKLVASAANVYTVDSVKSQLNTLITSGGLMTDYWLIIGHSYYLGGLLPSAEQRKTNNETVFVDGKIESICGVKVIVVADAELPTGVFGILFNKNALNVGAGIEGDAYRDADTYVGLTAGNLPIHTRILYNAVSKKWHIDAYIPFGLKPDANISKFASLIKAS